MLQHVQVPCSRELQIQFDGLGWTSRVGSMRLIARTPQTKRDHNSTRYARDAVFALGKDKNEELHKMNELGGEASLKSRLQAGIKVTKRDHAELPAHVQEDPLFADLACYECAFGACSGCVALGGGAARDLLILAASVCIICLLMDCMETSGLNSSTLHKGAKSRSRCRCPARRSPRQRPEPPRRPRHQPPPQPPPDEIVFQE